MAYSKVTAKANKVKNPKAQFTSESGTKQGFVQHKTYDTAKFATVALIMQLIQTKMNNYGA